ncbi:MAG: hypothetical protein H0T78_02035 [Longispora sp.]|nr:hypothetical protein [Longispora sp. (in: high G+C Gram-positive bacteria)]
MIANAVVAIDTCDRKVVADLLWYAQRSGWQQDKGQNGIHIFSRGSTVVSFDGAHVALRAAGRDRGRIAVDNVEQAVGVLVALGVVEPDWWSW